MTSLGKLMSASATSFHERRVCVSAAHPMDETDGCLIQSEMSAADQAATGKRFHCLSLLEEEIPAVIKALKKAARHSRSIRRKVDAARERASLSDPSTGTAREAKP